MPKLKISLKGDEYTDQQKKDMWLLIHYLARCPECGSIDSMLAGPSGGLSVNIKCKDCHVVFFTTPFAALGAYPISIDKPPRGERILIDENKG